MIAGSLNISGESSAKTTPGVSSWADAVRRRSGGGNNEASEIPPPNPPPPQLPEDLELTAKSVAVAADEPASKNLDKSASENVNVLKESPEIKSSSVSSPVIAVPPKECGGSNANRKRSIRKPCVGASPPNLSPHGVAHYQYGSHPRPVVAQYYPHPRGVNHGNFAHVRPPPFYIGMDHMVAYRPPPPWPYWGINHRPDSWDTPFRPPPHHLPPAGSIPNISMSQKIVKQIDYYFSESNLVKDVFLRSKMDSEGWVPISLIASFPRVKQMQTSIPFIITSLRSSKVVEVQGNKIRKCDNWEKWIRVDAT